MSGRRNLPRTAAATAVVALLAACGSVGGTQSSGTTAAPGKGPATIKVTSGPSARPSAGAAVQGADKAVAPGVATGMAPYRPATYVVSGTLPALDGDAQAWTYPAGGADVTEAAVAKLAKALGLDGTVSAVPSDQGGGFRVGPDDGSAPVLTVSTDAAGSWWYADNAVLSSGVGCAGAAELVPATTDASGRTAAATTIALPTDCTVPPPPAGVPSADEAEARAAALAVALGRKVDAADIEVTGDDYGRYATLYERLDGIRSPMTMSASFGAGGHLQYANGVLATAQKADRYPRIGTTAALEALKAGDTGWFGGGVPMMASGTAPAVASDTPGVGAPEAGGVASSAAVEPGATGAASGSSGGGSADAPGAVAGQPPVCETPDPAVPETVVAPGVATRAAEPVCGAVDATAMTEPIPVSVDPVVVTITAVREAFVQLYGTDGQIWLLPGYEFVTDGNGSIVVPAVDKSYVEVVEPPVATGPGGAKPMPAPEPAPDAAPPTSAATATVAPTTTVVCVTTPCP